MPSIIPSYIYSFLALSIVGTLLICTFSLFSVSLKQDVEIEQLKNVLEHLAAESCEIISTTQTNNSTVTVRIPMPSCLSEKQYWIQLKSDALKTWLEGGIGNTPTQTNYKIFIPGMANASGLYFSSYGLAELECQLQGNIVYLNLSQESQA